MILKNVKTGTLSQEELDELFSAVTYGSFHSSVQCGDTSHFLFYVLLAGEYARKKPGGNRFGGNNR